MSYRDDEETNSGPTPDALRLLRSYASGPRIWDATSILPSVQALASQGLIEPGDNGAYWLTEAGRAALGMTAPPTMT